MCRLACAVLLVLAIPWPASADVYRHDNGEPIPGTEGITPGPGVDLRRLNLSFADLEHLDLTAARFANSNLTGAAMAEANLTDADLGHTRLAGADLSGAIINGADLDGVGSSGFLPQQLYATASYQARDLSNIVFSDNDLTGWDFTDQDLSGADLSACPMTGAIFSGAIIKGADFAETTSAGFSAEQFYATASYQQGDLTGIELSENDFRGWSFAGLDLSGADLSRTLLGGVDFTGAIVATTNLSRTTRVGDFTRDQLYSTASYQAGDLRGIQLCTNDLSGWSFAGQDLREARLNNTDLASADFSGANLTGAVLWETTLTGAGFEGADLTAADLRDAEDFTPAPSTVLRNTILPDATLRGLQLGVEDALLIRLGFELDEVLVRDAFDVATGGILEVLIDELEPSIVVDDAVLPRLGGTFRIHANSLLEAGLTLDIFDWSGSLAPSNRFDRIELPPGDYNWNLIALYTSGEIVLHEPGLPDYDANGVVDQSDLDLVLLNWGEEIEDPAGQGWYNSLPTGRVDQQELDQVLLFWGESAFAAGSAATAVPEPSTLVVAFVAAWVACCCHLQKRARICGHRSPGIHV